MTDEVPPIQKAVILDKPEQIKAYSLLVLEHSVKFRAQTGMSVTRTMPTVKQLKSRWPHIFPANVRTYKGAYEAIKAHNDKNIRKVK